MSSSAFTPSTTTVTNNVPVNVPVVTAWEAYTPTGSWTTNTTYTGRWRRIGESIHVQVKVSLSGAPNSQILTITLPSGLNANTLSMASSDTITNALGTWVAVRQGIGFYNGVIGYSSTNSICLTVNSSGLVVNHTNPAIWASGDFLSVNFMLPISEWSGSGTTTLATRAVEEYASNSSTSTTGNGTEFAYGPSGSPIRAYGSGANVAHSYTVRFQSPILATDSLILEVSLDRIVWVKIPHYAISGGSTINEFGHTTTSYYGIGLRKDAGTTADVNVVFGGAGTNSNLDSWGSFTNYFWRVRKVSGGAQVGYPVSARNIVGDTSGSVVPTGMLGEQVLFTTRSVSAVTPNWVASTSPLITLTPGTWILFPQITGIAAAGLTSVLAFLSTDTNNDSTGNLSLENGAFVLAANATINQSDIPMAMIYLNVTQNTPIYAKARTSGANTTITLKGRAIRIA